MAQQEQDSGTTYADIWGEAVHSNRHLRVLSMALAGLVLLLVVIIVRLSSIDLPKPIVVRVDEVGRAEALAYEMVEARPIHWTRRPSIFLTDSLTTTTADGARRSNNHGPARSGF